MAGFRLASSFINGSRTRLGNPWESNGLGEVVYQRTYKRPGESWPTTCQRVVEGWADMLSQHTKPGSVFADPGRVRDYGQEMYERMYTMKFLPPGRGLWAMGSPLTREKKLYAALNNCGFVSTKDLAKDPIGPFTFLMDASMLGVGIGFDTAGAGTVNVCPSSYGGKDTYGRCRSTYEVVIPDSREGWVEALRQLLLHFFNGAAYPIFDYSLVREAGMPLKGFGGVSAGPGPLKYALETISELLESRRGQLLSITDITDIANIIGKCVVSGNVRRSAEIAFGPADSDEFLNLKNYAENPQRADHGWVSNNSIFAEVGMEYIDVARRIRENGEPGLFWLENARNYSRMNGAKDFADIRVMGANPCVEQTLESYELCCLVETFPHAHGDMSDFLRTLEVAHIYAKTVTLGATHWPKVNKVMRRNHRMGVSMSGIAQFLHARGHQVLSTWCNVGYKFLRECDRVVSRDLGVPKSIKLTSVKPSGTVSLLARATPGLHHPIAPYYIRRVRMPANSPLVPCLAKAGYHVEPAADGVPGTTVVVEFPTAVADAKAVHGGGRSTQIKTVGEMSIGEQMEVAAFMQRHWSDNAVSATITFDPEKVTDAEIVENLDKYQHHLKGISMLPVSTSPGGAGGTTYVQMPYEAITAERYHDMVKSLGPIVWDDEAEQHNEVKHHTYCDGGACELKAQNL